MRITRDIEELMEKRPVERRVWNWPDGWKSWFRKFAEKHVFADGPVKVIRPQKS